MNKINNAFSIVNKDIKSFTKGYNYYKFFCIFLIGGIAGFLLETLWCYFITHHFESRTALVIGFFNPIYGIGAIIMSILSIILKNKNKLIIFIASMIIGGLFEVLCSVIQEMLFGTVSWYYDADSLGILGKRTSIIYCILWGILGIIWIKYFQPLLEKCIEKLPNKIGILLIWILTIFLIFDIILSFLAIYRQKERRNEIPANNIIRQYLDTKYNDEVLKKIYPNMTVVEK